MWRNIAVGCSDVATFRPPAILSANGKTGRTRCVSAGSHALHYATNGCIDGSIARSLLHRDHLFPGSTPPVGIAASKGEWTKRRTAPRCSNDSCVEVRGGLSLANMGNVARNGVNPRKPVQARWDRGWGCTPEPQKIPSLQIQPGQERVSACAGRLLAIDASDVIAGLAGAVLDVGLARKVFFVGADTQVEPGDLHVVDGQVGYTLLMAGVSNAPPEWQCWPLYQAKNS